MKTTRFFTSPVFFRFHADRFFWHRAQERNSHRLVNLFLREYVPIKVSGSAGDKLAGSSLVGDVIDWHIRKHVIHRWSVCNCHDYSIRRPRPTDRSARDNSFKRGLPLHFFSFCQSRPINPIKLLLQQILMKQCPPALQFSAH